MVEEGYLELRTAPTAQELFDALNDLDIPLDEIEFGNFTEVRLSKCSPRWNDIDDEHKVDWNNDPIQLPAPR